MNIMQMLIIELCMIFVICAMYLYGPCFKILRREGYKYDSIAGLDIDKATILKGLAVFGIFLSHIATHVNVINENTGALFKLFDYTLISLGDIGVAVFFFMSGYGNRISLKKCLTKKDIGYWFLKRIKKVICVFLVCYILTLLTDVILFNYRPSIFNCMSEIFTLSMPQATTWYLKVQCLFYVITLIACLLKSRYSCTIIFVCSAIYSVIAYKVGLNNFWWQTAYCYVIGYFFANSGDTICAKLHTKFENRILFFTEVFGLLLTIFVAVFIARDSYILKVLSFSVIAILIMLLTYEAPIANRTVIHNIYMFFGKNSFEIYLLHAGIIASVLPNTEGGRDIIHIIIFVICTLVLVGIVAAFKSIQFRKKQNEKNI